MANEQRERQQPTPKTNRRAEIETLGGQLFLELFQADRGQTMPEGLAIKALAAAAEFYKVCDQTSGG